MISGNIEVVLLKLGTTIVHQKRNKMAPLVLPLIFSDEWLELSIENDLHVGMRFAI